MDIADVDLNLLVVFDALLRNRSVSGAARALKMSQPATSFALNRLRKMFGEPLFFASQHGRTGAAQWWAEFVATFGLLFACAARTARSRRGCCAR